jgi:glycosyltransferase involved in cell wall biosynthesis
MKIAFVSICGFPWGGSEILWTDTAREALLQGHEVLISVFDWTQQHDKIEDLKAKGAKIIYRRRFYPGFFTRFKKKLFNIFLISAKKYTYHDYLNRFRADHILFNLAGGDEIAADTTDLMVFVEQTKIPFSVFYHSLSTENYLSGTIAENFRFVLKKANYNFFTSQMQINLLQQQLQCSIDKAIIVNHPVREPSLISKSNVDKDIFNFCIVGSLVTRWKGQDMVIRILSKKHWRYLNWQLNIYGEGEDKEALLNLINEKKLTDKVTLHGYTDDVNYLFAKNDIVLIPSIQDSGPIVLFEAMLATKPVVGTFMGAMPDYITNYKTGVLAKDITENEFEIALEAAWKYRCKWEEWGKAARTKILTSYDFEPHKTLLGKLLQHS